MGDPTVVCRSCGITAAHSPGDPMALCPACGAPLPVTLEVREARALQEAAPERPGVRRPEPFLDTGSASPGTGGAGWLLWLVLALLVAAAVVVWKYAPITRISP